jgi:hypothetical protein
MCSSEYCQLCNLTTIFQLQRSVTETVVFWDMFLKDLIHNTLSIITFIFLFLPLLHLSFPFYATEPLPYVYLFTTLVIFKAFSLPLAYIILP